MKVETSVPVENDHTYEDEFEETKGVRRSGTGVGLGGEVEETVTLGESVDPRQEEAFAEDFERFCGDHSQNV